MSSNSEKAFFSLFLLGATFILANCGTSLPKPIDPEIGYVEEGLASWYGPGYHGKLTASGETYDMYQMTAAHRRLPLGTTVKVRSLATGRSVIVNINDRGPFIRGRIIDLSYAAARSLRMIGKGIERVRLVVLKKPPSSGPFWVQVSAFETLQEAQALRHELKKHFARVRVVSIKLSTGKQYSVQVGEFQTESRARAAAKKLKTNWGATPMVFGP